MGRINLVLPDDLEERFRAAVFERKGMKKGNLQEAVVEAVVAWVERGQP